LVLVGTVLVALPMAPAHASAAPRGVQTICIHVYAGIKPRPVHVGDEVVFISDWENCGKSAYMRFVFGVRAPARCPGWGVHNDFHYRLHKGEGFGEGTGGQVDCPGVYRVTAKAYHDGELIGRSSRWVRVLP
jgi:hypothetical protein